jgi:hypothetical protein
MMDIFEGFILLFLYALGVLMTLFATFYIFVGIQDKDKNAVKIGLVLYIIVIIGYLL